MLNPKRRRRRVHRRRRRSLALVRRPRGILMNPRRRRRGVRRRRSGGFGGMGRGFLGDLKSLMDRPTITIAAGAVGSGLLSGYILSKFGGAQPAGAFSLPGSSNTYGVIAYQLLIPVGGAFLIKRFSPNLAKGMILGGLIAAIQSVIAIAMPTPTAAATTGTSAYLNNMRPVSAMPPGYSAIDAFGASIYSSEPAFHGAWGGN